MKEPQELSVESLIQVLAEKLADKLAQDPNRLCPRLLTIEQAAAYLGRSREAIQHLASSGKIPTVRSDRRVFLDRLDLDKWIDDNKTGWV